MLNRRFLRIKVMQALYAYSKHEKADMAFFEKELFKSLDKIYDLYVYILSLLDNIHHTSQLVLEEHKNKYLPTKEDLDPNLKFIENSILKAISTSSVLKKEITNRKISWQNDFDLVRKLYNEIKALDLYKDYMSSENRTVNDDKDFLNTLVSDYLFNQDVLASLFEEKNIHWTDDSFIAYTMVLRTIDMYDGQFKLLPLYKDAEDDKNFVSNLFRKSIIYSDEYESLIQSKTKNWELERIAAMDVLLMKMAVTEFVHLNNIPVKVSLNEYIDVSKEYSTPNSKLFINGILDKIIVDLKSQNKIQKTGRGLLEN